MTTLARMCSWCARFRSPADAALHAGGAKVTHSICPSCEVRMMADLEALMGPEQVAA